MSIKKIEHKSCKGNHKDSKKIVGMSRSISMKGRSETRGESERDKDREPQNDGNQGTNQGRDQYSHYMCQMKHIILHVSNCKRQRHKISETTTRSAFAQLRHEKLRRQT